MIQAVLDTNVLISALIRDGKPRKLLLEMVRGKADLILSREILEEFAEVAADQKIRKYVDEEDVAEFLRIICGVAKIIEVRSRFNTVQRDPGDDIILRIAYDADADFIISGDEHLLSLREFRGIEILTVNDFLCSIS
jgi:putative PIN family toxin of toxin-antitoxin system